jgi:hypothetical protein
MVSRGAADTRRAACAHPKPGYHLLPVRTIALIGAETGTFQGRQACRGFLSAPDFFDQPVLPESHNGICREYFLLVQSAANGLDVSFILPEPVGRGLYRVVRLGLVRLELASRSRQ